MKNRKQTQLDVCRAILDGNRRCSMCELNDNEIAVTVDGYTAYVFEKNECVFDIEKIAKAQGIKAHFEDVDNDTEIKPSGEIFKVGEKLVERYIGENLELLVDRKVAEKFQGLNLYANNNRGRILAKDFFGRIIALFLPMSPDTLKYKNYKQRTEENDGRAKDVCKDDN